MHSFSPYKRGIGPDIFCPGYSVNLKKKENFKKKEKIELIFTVLRNVLFCHGLHLEGEALTGLSSCSEKLLDLGLSAEVFLSYSLAVEFFLKKRLFESKFFFRDNRALKKGDSLKFFLSPQR